MNQYPSTAADHIFGDLTQKCWHGGYHSVEAVEQDVASLLGTHTDVEEYLESGTLALNGIKAQCIEFLEKNSTTSTPQGL
jgi:hypothetical protein